MLLASIDAHGGLARWYSNGPVRFRYAYDRLDGNAPLDTEQTVDTWSSRARHTVVADSSTASPAQFGWTAPTPGCCRPAPSCRRTRGLIVEKWRRKQPTALPFVFSSTASGRSPPYYLRQDKKHGD